VAVIYRNDLFGRGFLSVLSGELDSLGVEITERDPYLAGITPFDAYAARLARRSPDLLVFAGGGADAAEVLRELRRLGSSLPAIGTDDMATLELDSALAREFAGVRYTRFYAGQRAEGAESTKFRSDFRAKYGSEPSQQSALSYDAAMIIGRAAIAVGGDRHRIRDWVASVGGNAPPHEGATGTIRFNSRGDAVGKAVYIGEVTP
jgi:branched-chain amino acid transport system substrate-binding protein